MISLNKILIVIGIVAIVVAGCFMAQQQQIKQRFYFLSFHCDNINYDFTRPDNRECVNPIEIKDNIFTFVNKGGRVEEYLVIGLNGGGTDIDVNSFIYNFMRYKED